MLMDQELVSIIVPIYKVEQYLDQCVLSIVNQTYKNIEIILIDDGSPDFCSKKCDEWAKKDPRISIIHKKNGGLSDARNAGLEICTGKFLTFIDSDDWIEPDYLKSLYCSLINNEAQICSCGSTVYIEDTKTVRKEKRIPFVGSQLDTYNMLYDQCKYPVDATPKMYESYIWNDIRFPVGKNYEDAFTTYKTIDRADKIVQISDLCYNYRIRNNSIMRSSFSLEVVNISNAWKENYLFCRENYPSVADLARSIWLEKIPSLIKQFPKKLSEEERREKKRLKKEIVENIGFILVKMPIKKKYHQVKALCFL